MVKQIITNARHRRANHFIATGLFSDLTSFSELERRIECLKTPNERGDAFEVFAEAYLATQKINQAADVWPDGTIPGDIVKKLELPAPGQPRPAFPGSNIVIDLGLICGLSLAITNCETLCRSAKSIFSPSMFSASHSRYRGNNRILIAVLIVACHANLGPFRRFGDLFAGHFCFDVFTNLLSSLVAIRARDVKPHMRSS